MKITRAANFQLLCAAAASVAVAVTAGCSGEKPDAIAPPTTVFGRQARELAVGVAAELSGESVSVATTVLAQDGTGRSDLDVALAAGSGGWVTSERCGDGRYCGDVRVAGPAPELRVRLTRPAGRVSTLSVTLTRRPRHARATALVHASAAAVRELHSLIIREHL